MRAPKAQSTKENIYELQLIKIKNFYYLKDAVERIKKQTACWRRIYPRHILDKALESEYAKKPQNSMIRKHGTK